ncbi:single-stranded DNA-binding protein, mitochondrial [Chelonus insularis]|uniref:single-stranded DNA-binding protein, mitochondrial n=1 Tax=Chelonus insularis TaxID=460826 RepID=UPI00158EB4B7|nr:single-stranded DNA-binding protein, mitochondrial [Chelonus insularis]XP_034938381.1 single-stranded DNA-binding protein, mitochondrial [Chelonus insularis]
MLLNKVINSTFRHTCRLNSRLFSSNVTELNHLEKTLNQVSLLGRVGGDPQKRGSEEHPVVIFSLATHTNYKVEGGDYVQRTDWHRICVFKPFLRDTVYTNLKKGQRVLVNGRLSYGEIKDDNGNQKTTTAIIANDVIFFPFQKS